jgi:3-methyladenine DNA glycosylase/8-oxoguanine DNA glycosylase
MLEIARLGGSIVVDPTDDHGIADALRQILQDQVLRDRLAAEAARLRWRSWDEYASEVWGFLVDDLPPTG